MLTAVRKPMTSMQGTMRRVGNPIPRRSPQHVVTLREGAFVRRASTTPPPAAPPGSPHENGNGNGDGMPIRSGRPAGYLSAGEKFLCDLPILLGHLSTCSTKGIGVALRNFGVVFLSYSFFLQTAFSNLPSLHIPALDALYSAVGGLALSVAGYLLISLGNWNHDKLTIRGERVGKWVGPSLYTFFFNQVRTLGFLLRSWMLSGASVVASSSLFAIGTDFSIFSGILIMLFFWRLNILGTFLYDCGFTGEMPRKEKHVAPVKAALEGNGPWPKNVPNGFQIFLGVAKAAVRELSILAVVGGVAEYFLQLTPLGRIFAGEMASFTHANWVKGLIYSVAGIGVLRFAYHRRWAHKRAEMENAARVTHEE